MNTTRRLFGLQAAQLVAAPSSILVPAGLFGIGVTAIVLPGRAHAIAPAFLGAFVATALYEIFTDFGLTKRMVSAVAAANARHAAKADDFDGMFSDDVELNVSQAWRFENGKIVGVNGAAYGGDPYAVRRASLNVNELDALRHTDTMNGWGSMVPASMRVPPDRRRQKLVVAYKEAHAEKQRSRTSRIVDPMYVRGFEKMGNGERVAGVFGRADDGALLVTWVNLRDLA